MSKPLKFNFKIQHCSDHDPDYPPHLLQNQASKGWRSSRFPNYPLYLQLQFEAPFRLTLLQFLCHQSLIPERIEIQCSSRPNSPFRSLGKVSFDSNAVNEYSVRQLKSITLDSQCYRLRLTIYKNHLNALNHFNQVSLILISPRGYTLSLSESSKILPKKDHSYSRKEESGVAKLLDDLKKEKLQAVSQQNYEKAKQLKERIFRLQKAAEEINDLEKRKAYAVQKQDFESAKVLKLKIDQLKEQIVNGPKKKTPLKPTIPLRTYPKQIQNDGYESEPNSQKNTIALKKGHISHYNQFQDVRPVQMGQCGLCLQRSPYLINEDVMDMHLYRQCAMTVLCIQCDQIVKVKSLNQHLLSQCQNKSYYKKCSACLEPVRQAQFKHHLQRKKCTPADQSKNRCPLCHQNIKGGDEGWRYHLVEIGCPAGRSKI